MTTNVYRQIAGPLPEAFEWIVDWIAHPLRGTRGSLVRNRRTGLYVLVAGGALVSVPQDWAAEQDASRQECRRADCDGGVD